MILKTTLEANEQREVAVRGDFIVCVGAKDSNGKEATLIFTFDNTKEIELKIGATYKADNIFNNFLIKNDSDMAITINVIIVLQGLITYPANIEAAITDSGLATELTLEKVAKQNTAIEINNSVRFGQLLTKNDITIPYLKLIMDTLGSPASDQFDSKGGHLQDLIKQGGPVNASYLSNIVQNQTLLLGQMLEVKALLTTAATIQSTNEGTFLTSSYVDFDAIETGYQSKIITQENVRRVDFIINIKTSPVAAGEVYELDGILSVGDEDNEPITTFNFTFKQNHAITEGVVLKTFPRQTLLTKEPFNDIKWGLSIRQINKPQNKNMAVDVRYRIYL